MTCNPQINFENASSNKSSIVILAMKGLRRNDDAMKNWSWYL